LGCNNNSLNEKRKIEIGITEEITYSLSSGFSFIWERRDEKKKRRIKRKEKD
jgi:hypothetical protein